MQNLSPLHNNAKIRLTAGLALFLLSLFLRLYYIHTTEFIDPIRADAKKYFLLAVNLYNMGVYSYETTPPFTPSSSITPGFPLFIYLHLMATNTLEDSYKLLQLSQAVLGSLTTALIFSLSIRVLRPALSIFLGIILAVSPHLVVFTGYILTETLFIFLLALECWLLVAAIEHNSKVVMIAAAIIAGLSTLTRPVVIFLFPLLLFVFIYKKWAKQNISAAALLVSILVVSPWYFWSTKISQQFPEKHSYLAGVLAFGSYPDFIYKSEAFRGYPYREDTQYEEMSESVASATRIILERAKAEPGKYLNWYLIGKPLCFWSWSMMESVGGPFIYEVGKNFWLDSLAGQIGLSFSKKLHILLVLSVVLTLFLLTLTLPGKKTLLPGTTLPARPPTALLAIVIVIYFTILHIFLAGWPRYSVPAWPFLYLLGLWGLQHISTIVVQYSRKGHADS